MQRGSEDLRSEKKQRRGLWGVRAFFDHRIAGWAGWGLCEDLSGLREGGDRERGEERERGGEAVKFRHCRVFLNSVLNF